MPRRGSRPTRFTWACRRWPRRRSRFRRKRSPLQHRPDRQHRRRWPRQQQRQRRRPHQRLRLLLPRHPHPQRRRHHPRPTIPGRHDNFGWRLKPKTSHRKTVLANRERRPTLPRAWRARDFEPLAPALLLDLARVDFLLHPFLNPASPTELASRVTAFRDGLYLVEFCVRRSDNGLGGLRVRRFAPFGHRGPPGPRSGNPRTWGHYARRAQYAADTWVPARALREGRAMWAGRHIP